MVFFLAKNEKDQGLSRFPGRDICGAVKNLRFLNSPRSEKKGAQSYVRVDRGKRADGRRHRGHNRHRGSRRVLSCQGQKEKEGRLHRKLRDLRHGMFVWL